MTQRYNTRDITYNRVVVSAWSVTSVGVAECNSKQ